MNKFCFLLLFFIYIFSKSVSGPISIFHVLPDSLPTRENVNGANVVPLLTFPGISQAEFKDAFKVLDECLVMDPGFGFQYPFIAPGGHYGQCWWQVDGAISVQATKWVNQKFSENMLRGFIAVQKPDGRIPLYGHDQVPGYPTCSSLPKFFGSAYAVLKHSTDKTLILETYSAMKRYLNWWFSDERRDAETGLITGVFEESFPPFENRLKAVAQVDLNVEIASGCRNLAQLADYLGRKEDLVRFSAMEKELTAAINKYMWNQQRGAYFAYLIDDKKMDDKLICYTFDPFVNNIAAPEHIEPMLKMLTDNRYFNWDGNAVTSAAKTDKIYNETTGTYNGNPAWSGDIWTLRNEVIVNGLEDIGRYDLAAELSLKTVKLFNGNYAEFIKPSDGAGHGEKRYAWSAAQYVQILVEKVFGVNYDRFSNTISIRPNISNNLTGQNLALEKLLLPDGRRLNLYITTSPGHTKIKYSISGGANKMNVTVGLPFYDKTVLKISNQENKAQKFSGKAQGAGTIFEMNNGTHKTGEFIFQFQNKNVK